MSAADNMKCEICRNNHHPMTECRDALRSLASAAGEGRVEWHGANLHSNIEGVTVPAWILSVNGRPILHAVALSEITELVSAEDRKMIGQALAEYLAHVNAHTPLTPQDHESLRTHSNYENTTN